MKQLLLCRHAKSSWKDMSLDDIDRPLNKRGKRDAPLMGKRLQRYGVSPDAVLSSPARRAKKTAGHICKELGFPKNRITIIPEIYEATPDELLELIHGFYDGYNKVMMVGHNPETTLLANLLGSINLVNVPTCGVVCLSFGVRSWKEVGYGCGEMFFFDYPKKDGGSVE
jgi:phosphohistidine phosphatase